MACANIERTPQHTMSIIPYPDSGLGLDYDSDTEECEEDKLSPVESEELGEETGCSDGESLAEAYRMRAKSCGCTNQICLSFTSNDHSVKTCRILYSTDISPPAPDRTTPA